ncbi:Crp/Fnr family transcriptional regulator [Actinoplanes derwentensis]|uniref:cAMP-binding domain of CRP or a regulatory subunit of cAMP-dependent protein kinases n=1 Tax=Actinoplanes derwentensis TaxID=113562 RepID=A0A1H1XBQ6_9ACTN|nr:Crp/Fnr family transcriptional regulator [Actinoplanes derwentensis]GID89633.1 Crp/Fnr family transcriptional regulator [Actinoplanes derwentensis]SDT06715.1 cAMP-binding domain of CRP or a regulatory subunit of cAMP-dependent protein kinases [Actinoplanes derwentensis]
MFHPGSQLCRQGDIGDYVYVLLAGAVKVVRSEPAGGRAVLTVRSAGDVIGDIAAIDGGRRSASASASVSVSVSALTVLTCRLLHGPDFRRFAERREVALGFARYAYRRLRKSDSQRTELAVLPVLERVARALVRLYDAAASEPGRNTIALPQQDLADLVGASRNAVVLALGVLRVERLIETGRRCITILDVPELRRRADG